MALDYQIRYEDRVVMVNMRGKFDYVSLDRLWKEIVATCKEHGCTSILGVADIESPPSSVAYDHASVFEFAGLSSDYRIAWVEQNPRAKDVASLTAAVVRNRGLATGQTFDSVRAARNWLTADSA